MLIMLIVLYLQLQITNLCEETLSSWSGRLFTKLIRALYNTRTWSSQQEDQSEMRGH